MLSCVKYNTCLGFSSVLLSEFLSCLCCSWMQVCSLSLVTDIVWILWKHSGFQFVLQPGAGPCKSQISLKASSSNMMFNMQYWCRNTDDPCWLLPGSAFVSLVKADTPSSPGTTNSTCQLQLLTRGPQETSRCSQSDFYQGPNSDQQ